MASHAIAASLRLVGPATGLTGAWRRLVRAVLLPFAAWRARGASGASLASLDERALRDIGLQRSSIDAAVHNIAERRARFHGLA